MSDLLHVDVTMVAARRPESFKTELPPPAAIDQHNFVRTDFGRIRQQRGRHH